MKKLTMVFFIAAGVASMTFVGCKKDKKENPPPSTGPQTGTMTDSRDSKTYNTVTIGSQTWMAQDLNYQGNTLTGGTYSCYNDNSTNCTTFGTLYTYEAANIACPSGWHLPSDEEWKTLEKGLGMSSTDADINDTWRGTDEGTKLKEGGSSGMNVKLGGNWDYVNNNYYNINSAGTFWTSTKPIGVDTAAYTRRVAQSESGVLRAIYDNRYRFCVRCLKN